MATPKIGDVTCFDIRGAFPPEQRSLSAEYHSDGIELDATEPRGGPFRFTVIMIDTLLTVQSNIDILSSYCGSDPVKITLADGQERDKCYLGGDSPASGVIHQGPIQAVEEAGTSKAMATIVVAGHVEY